MLNPKNGCIWDIVLRVRLCLTSKPHTLRGVRLCLTSKPVRDERKALNTEVSLFWHFKLPKSFPVLRSVGGKVDHWWGAQCARDNVGVVCAKVESRNLLRCYKELTQWSSPNWECDIISQLFRCVKMVFLSVVPRVCT